MQSNNTSKPLISIAPMLDITNDYFRFFMRLITSEATLYTEMMHHNTILMNPKGFREMLRFEQCNHPVVLQLGGSKPEMLAECCRMAEQVGYDEVNLNVGCPSARVQENQFGACLMKQPELVAELGKAMKQSTKLPCTVKCRLGVDELDSYEFVHEFVRTVSEKSNINHFIIHARKAHLKGLSPTENRNIPPLRYDYVYKLQKDFKDIDFTLNGGIRTIDQAVNQLQEHKLEGCMIGRGAYEDPWEMRKVDPIVYNRPSKNYCREEILHLYSDFVETTMEEINPKASLPMKLKPLSNFLCGVRESSKYRQYLSRTRELEKLESFNEIIHESIRLMNEHCPGESTKRKYDDMDKSL